MWAAAFVFFLPFLLLFSTFLLDRQQSQHSSYGQLFQPPLVCLHSQSRRSHTRISSISRCGRPEAGAEFAAGVVGALPFALFLKADDAVAWGARLDETASLAASFASTTSTTF